MLATPDLEAFVDMCERVADDPDAPAPVGYRDSMLWHAQQGAVVGLRHAAPLVLSVDSKFLERIHNA